MDETTTRELTDEDIRTVMPGSAAPIEAETDPDGMDGDGKDGDADDQDATDPKDDTDTQDADGTDSTS